MLANNNQPLGQGNLGLGRGKQILPTPKPLFNPPPITGNRPSVNPAQNPMASGPVGPGGNIGRMAIPGQASGSFAMPGLTQHPQAAANRPTGTPAVPAWLTQPAAKSMSAKDVLNQIMTLANSIGGGAHVPPALTIAKIAKLYSSLPTTPNMPGKFSITSIQQAMKGGAGTPGYVDPKAAAAAAAQQQYGGAVSGDQLGIQQQQAQNQQSQQDIQNWYQSLVGLEHSNAAADASGYNTAVNNTGTLGPGISSALGFDAGSAGADTINQTGSILNAAARMAGASGEQYDRNLQSYSALAGVQDLQNQTNQGNNAVQVMRNTLNSDQKSKGAAYTTALNAAQQANTGNAHDYAAGLLGLNQQYNSNFQNMIKNKAGVASAMQGLNSQYNANSLNNFKTKLSALGMAEGVSLIPGQVAASGAKTLGTTAHAYKDWATGQADLIKAQTAKTVANLKGKGQTLTGNTPAAAAARYSLAGNIVKVVSADPKVFGTDPKNPGVPVLKNKKLAHADIARMIALAGLDPTTAAGGMLNDIINGMVSGTP